MHRKFVYILILILVIANMLMQIDTWRIYIWNRLALSNMTASVCAMLLLLNCDSPEICDSWIYPLSLLLLFSDTTTVIQMLVESLIHWEILFTRGGFALIRLETRNGGAY